MTGWNFDLNEIRQLDKVVESKMVGVKEHEPLRADLEELLVRASEEEAPE